MYTCGSPGSAEGIGVTHRDVVALATDPCWGGGADGRVLLHSPCAFDASTYELWVPLLSGGAVVVAPSGELDVAALEAVIPKGEVTGLGLAAGVFQLIEREPPRGAARLPIAGDLREVRVCVDDRAVP